jgi:hypothetical protein
MGRFSQTGTMPAAGSSASYRVAAGGGAQPRVLDHLGGMTGGVVEEGEPGAVGRHGGLELVGGVVDVRAAPAQHVQAHDRPVAGVEGGGHADARRIEGEGGAPLGVEAVGPAAGQGVRPALLLAVGVPGAGGAAAQRVGLGIDHPAGVIEGGLAGRGHTERAHRRLMHAVGMGGASGRAAARWTDGHFIGLGLQRRGASNRSGPAILRRLPPSIATCHNSYRLSLFGLERNKISFPFPLGTGLVL